MRLGLAQRQDVLNTGIQEVIELITFLRGIPRNDGLCGLWVTPRKPRPAGLLATRPSQCMSNSPDPRGPA